MTKAMTMAASGEEPPGVSTTTRRGRRGRLTAAGGGLVRIGPGGHTATGSTSPCLMSSA
jgi:hypothetical protein